VSFVTNQMICCDYLAKKHHKNCLLCYKWLKFLDETLVSKPSHNNAVVIIQNEVAVTVCKQPRNPEYSWLFVLQSFRYHGYPRYFSLAFDRAVVSHRPINKRCLQRKMCDTKRMDKCEKGLWLSGCPLDVATFKMFQYSVWWSAEGPIFCGPVGRNSFENLLKYALQRCSKIALHCSEWFVLETTSF